MNSMLAMLLAIMLCGPAMAQPISPAPADAAIVSLTASANMQVDNDRMTIQLLAQAERPTAAAAAAEVNAKMAKALAVAKAVASVTARTLNYNTHQVMEKDKLVRWRVTQILHLETADFAAGANLVTRLQDDGLLISSLIFGVSPESRRQAMAKLQHDALVEWRSIAKQAATSMGYAGYVPGRLSVNTGDNGPSPRYALTAMAARAADQVTVSAGSSEMTATVTGEAILTGPGRRE